MAKRKQQSNKARKKAAPRRSEGPFSWLLFWPFHLLFVFTRGLSTPLRILLRLAGIPAVAGLYVLAVLSVIYGFRSSGYDLNRINLMPERTIILDRQGTEIGRIHGEKRSIVPLKDVSEDFRKAILAREDERFYSHGAIDIIGIGRAILKNIEGKREGASTITQQLTSDVFQLKLGEKRGDLPRQLDRKMLEIAIAFRINAALSKDQILEAYINQINWGRQIKGIGEASRIYFEKHPAELTLSESALLAGIVRGPDAYNPFSSMKAAERERNTTLARMVVAEKISQSQADEAKKEPIIVRPAWRRDYQQSYAMDAIRRDLEIILEQENIQLGGLTITTTIDQRLQTIAEEALDKKLRETERLSGFKHQTRAAWQNLPKDERKNPQYIQGAAVLIENRTGAVLSLVGGRDANESQFNRAIQARRQIGSIFKPFVYLAAFDKGLRPSTSISDGPIRRGEIKGAPTWKPSNSDGKFGGMNPASYGLIRSRNTMSVRIGNYAGISKVKEVSRMAGFGTAMPETPSSYLGSWEATPWEVATAYTIFPNDGTRYRPYLISEIKDRDGNILYTTPPLSYPATNTGSAWSVSKILEQVATTGTAAAVKRLGFDKDAAGKTGTTNDFKDAWFAGYTSTLTCAVWVGFDQPKRTISRGYGSVLALPVWVEVMKTADRLGYKAGDLHSNIRMISAELCKLSGKRATSGCHRAGTSSTEQIPADTAPDSTDLCPIHPAKAQPVSEKNIPPPSRQRPRQQTPPPRAKPVRETPPLRAETVKERPLRAQPVQEPATQRAIPVD
ncbi:MAG: transglycosylase domain-containing protein [Verrucomicrobia bacterium]|nr:transglycosylase domain-containing protein [Verrucomicrobiota bacterium]|tara:strand:- start:50885 stop:53251 length:2367 start_codon:yes stop_codon:yes gene_type:complete